MLVYVVNCTFNIFRTYPTLPKHLDHLTILPAEPELPVSPYPGLHGIVSICISAFLVGRYVKVLQCGFNFIFLMTNNVRIFLVFILLKGLFKSNPFYCVVLRWSWKHFKYVMDTTP